MKVGPIPLNLAHAGKLLGSSQRIRSQPAGCRRTEVSGISIGLRRWIAPQRENDIRKALADIADIRSLLSTSRNAHWPLMPTRQTLDIALAAIRNLRFDPLPVQPTSTAVPSSAGSDFRGAAIALALAIGAEAIDYLAPETTAMKVLGMSVAAAAIWFSGIATYRKGLRTLCGAVS